MAIKGAKTYKKDAALEHLDEGMAIFPIRENTKLPAVPWTTDGLVTSKQEAIDWWTQFPYDNIGINCGESALFIVDLDGPGGRANFLGLWEAQGDYYARDGSVWGYTRWSYTANEGIHLWFNMPRKPLGNTAGKLAPYVDTRGRGGMIVAPGSSINGKYYDYHRPLADIADLPAWLEARLRNLEPSPMAKLHVAPWLRLKAKRRLRQAVNEIISTGHEGNRNHTLNAQAFAIRQAVPALGYGEVEHELLMAASEIGLPEAEAARTIRSALGGVE